MEYFKVSSIAPAVAYLTLEISRHLADGKNVLWLVPGGSGISIAVDVAKNLTSANVKNLTICLTDERYGPAGHANSNWAQLLQAGFKLPGAKMVPVLTNGNIHQITEAYIKLLKECLDKTDFCIALTGIGADGHTFGIKPRSPAVVSNDIVVTYEDKDYVRLTPTLKLIEKLDEVVVYAVGEGKHKQLKMLDRNLTIDEQPAQLLKQLKKVVIFNDYKGKEL